MSELPTKICIFYISHSAAHTIFFSLLIILFGNGKGTFVPIHAMMTYGYWTDVSVHPSTSRPWREPIEYSAAWAWDFAMNLHRKSLLPLPRKISEECKLLCLSRCRFLQPSVMPMYLKSRYVTGLSACKYTFPPPNLLIRVFLGAFAKLRKATVCFVMSSCPSVRPLGTIRLPLDGFACNFVLHDFSKIYREIQVSLKSDNNEYLTWRPI